MPTMTVGTRTGVETELARIFNAVGVRASVHARAIGRTDAVALDADRPLAIGSVFKILVLQALVNAEAAGEISLAERLVVTPADHVRGPTGLSVFSDPVELSLRDAALLMMSVSDNTSTDLVMRAVGIDRINALAGELGLGQTAVRQDCAEVIASIISDLSAAGHVDGHPDA